MALGIVLALIGGVAAFILVSNAINQPPPVVEVKNDIWVAKVDIPERTQIRPEFVSKAAWPVSVIPPNTMSATLKIEDQFTTEPIKVGQPILKDQLRAGTTISYTTYPWPAGKVIIGVQLPRASELIRAGALKEGDFIDLILQVGSTYHVGMQNLQVFAIGDLNPPAPTVDAEGKVQPPPAEAASTYFLFNVTPEDALILRFMAALDPDMWVRSPLESPEQQFNLPAVDPNYIAQKYRIEGLSGTGAQTTRPGQPGQPTQPGQPQPQQPQQPQQPLPQPGQPPAPGQP